MRLFLLMIRDFPMCFLFRKPIGEMFRGAFVFRNFIITEFQFSCNSAYKILEQSSENTLEVSAVEDMLPINDKKQPMENDAGHYPRFGGCQSNPQPRKPVCDDQGFHTRKPVF